MTSYQVDYDGYYAMSHHDREENALKRWFDNYKIERYASFAGDTEWLIVKEVPATCRMRKLRFVCEIGDDGRGTKREVIMDHTAPPAPLLTFAAKRRYEPPPPKSPDELRRDAEWARMAMMGFRPVARRVPRPGTSLGPMSKGMNFATMPDFNDEYEITIEWVRDSPWRFDIPVARQTPPPTPRHRRNA
jgi:hypothetical protein